MARPPAPPRPLSRPANRPALDHIRAPSRLRCAGLVILQEVADRDQHVVIYTADPGSSSEEALRLLSVVGTQGMNVSG